MTKRMACLLLCAMMLLCACCAMAECDHDDESMISYRHIQKLVPGEVWKDDGNGETHSGLVEEYDVFACYLCDGEWEENYAVTTVTHEHDFFRGECLDCHAACSHGQYTTQSGLYRLIEGGAWKDDENGLTHSGMCESYKLHTCQICGDEWESFVSDKSVTESHVFGGDRLCDGCGYERLKITKQPSGKTVEIGAYAKTSIAARGDGLTYQWYYKDPGQTSFTKGTCVTANYSVKMTQARNGRKIYCKVTDQYGNTVKSNTVTLKATTPLKIITQPVGTSAAFGKNVTMTIVAQGDGLTYAWYNKNVGESSFTKGASTTAKYVATMSKARNGRQVYCVVTDKYGNTAKSNTVTIYGYTALAITTQPSGKTVAIGSYAKTSVAAAGEGLTYQWYYKDPGSSSFTKGTCTSENYSVKMTEARNGRQIYCQIKDSHGNSVKTNTVTLKGYVPLKITTQPVGKTVAFGKNVTMIIEAQGEGLTYAWYNKNVGESGFTKGTSTTAKYVATMNKERNGRQVYCVVTDKYGNTAKSNTVTIYGYTALKITTQPSGKTVAIGSYAKTSVAAEGEGLTYQWYYKDPGSSSFTKGTCTSANYSVKMTQARDGRQIYCQIKDSHGNSIKTNTVTFTAK